MKTKTTGLPTRFARPTRFQVRPRVLTRAEREVRLGELKNRLLRLHLAEADTSELCPVVRRAAEDAASLAWPPPTRCSSSQNWSRKRWPRPESKPPGRRKSGANTAGFLAEAA